MHDTGMCSTASVAQQLSQIRATAKCEQTDYDYPGRPRKCVAWTYMTPFVQVNVLLYRFDMYFSDSGALGKL